MESHPRGSRRKKKRHFAVERYRTTCLPRVHQKPVRMKGFTGKAASREDVRGQLCAGWGKAGSRK